MHTRTEEDDENTEDTERLNGKMSTDQGGQRERPVQKICGIGPEKDENNGHEEYKGDDRHKMVANPLEHNPKNGSSHNGARRQMFLPP